MDCWYNIFLSSWKQAVYSTALDGIWVNQSWLYIFISSGIVYFTLYVFFFFFFLIDHF